MPAGGSPSPVLPIDAATISLETVGTVEAIELEVTRRCSACLQALQRALPPLNDNGEAASHGLPAEDMGTNDLIGSSIEKCATTLVSIVRDCPVAHTSWPLESEVRRPCCCDIVSRTRRDIELELRARYGDRGILPRVGDRPSLQGPQLAGRKGAVSPSKHGAESCPTSLGPCDPPTLSDAASSRVSSPVVREVVTLPTTGRSDGLLQEPIRRLPEATDNTADASSTKELVLGDVCRGPLVIDGERVDGARVVVKAEEVEATATAQELNANGTSTGTTERCETSRRRKESSSIACQDGTRKRLAPEETHDGLPPANDGALEQDGGGVAGEGKASPRADGDVVGVPSDEAYGDGVEESGGRGDAPGSHRTNDDCLTGGTEQAFQSLSFDDQDRREVPTATSLVVPASCRKRTRSEGEMSSGAAGNVRASRSEVEKEEAASLVRSGRSSEERPVEDGTPQDLESQHKQTSKRRCRREGCSETPVHGPEGELPLWCHQHYFAQEQGCPLRCYVLQKDASGGFKACWRETAWAWRGKPPTHCTLHKHLGMVDVVEFFKERFDKVVWPKLSGMGWRREKSNRPRYPWWMPPNVFRRVAKFRSRIDYFDSKPQVIRHCLGNEKYYGWMLEKLLKASSGSSAVPLAVAEKVTMGNRAASGACSRVLSSSANLASAVRSVDASSNGKICATSAATTSTARAAVFAHASSVTVHRRNRRHQEVFKRRQQRQQQQQIQRRQTSEEPPPNKSGPAASPTAFTHQLFSLNPSSARKGDGVVSGAAPTAAKATTPETRNEDEGESARDRQDDGRRGEYRWQRAARLRALGHDPRLVTKIGLTQSMKRAKVFANLLGPCRDPGDPLAALVASLGEFDQLRPRADKNRTRRTPSVESDEGCDCGVGDHGVEAGNVRDRALEVHGSKCRAEELEELVEMDNVPISARRDQLSPEPSLGRGKESKSTSSPPTPNDAELGCEIRCEQALGDLRLDDRDGCTDFSAEKGNSDAGRIFRGTSSTVVSAGRGKEDVGGKEMFLAKDKGERTSREQIGKRKAVWLRKL